ncbi:MAG TPA: hypothetical protein PLW65_07130 [Pseudomonadota bacterium]|nr:hypothetical protein [Pseudomonadota bacterium]
MGSYRRTPGPGAGAALAGPWFLLVLLALPARTDKGAEEVLQQADLLAQESTERQLIAEGRLGEIAWRSSCPVPDVAGICIKLERKAASVSSSLQAKLTRFKYARGPLHIAVPRRVEDPCGPETRARITLYPREPALVMQAMAHFQKVAALFQGGRALLQAPGTDRPSEQAEGRLQVVHFAAYALMVKGDREYEKMLAMHPPPGPYVGIDDHVHVKGGIAAPASEKRFRSWVMDEVKQLDVAKQIYLNVIELKDPHWTIAATARIGQLYRDFANSLDTIELPPLPRPILGVDIDDWTRIFRYRNCAYILDAATPGVRRAEEALTACLHKTKELGLYNEWSQLCELELHQLIPDKYPLPSEIYAEPGASSLSLDVAPISNSAPGRK